MKNRRVLAAVSVIIVLVLVIGGLYALRGDDNAQASDNPVADVTRPKKETTTTSSTLPELPQPENAPADEYADVPINQIGTIEIPAIGLTHKMYEGVELTVLNVGPGHWPGTAQPGHYGNTVIAGHRVTHSHPFRKIDQLKVGDDIFVTTDEGRFNYKVTGTNIVYPKDIWIVDQKPNFKLTLFACHPPGSARQRYVVTAELVDPPFEVPANLKG